MTRRPICIRKIWNGGGWFICLCVGTLVLKAPGWAMTYRLGRVNLLAVDCYHACVTHTHTQKCSNEKKSLDK